MTPEWPRHRRWETVAELDRLRDELRAWGEHRRDPHPDAGGGDAHSQYEQHLQAVELEVGDALSAIRELADNTAGADAGALADAFAKIDRQVIWLRQAWHFFRTKLDQRDDPTLRPALLAADAMIWSCYKPFFGEVASIPAPPPLPCVEFDYAPTSVLHDHQHVLPRATDTGGLLDDYFDTLPIAILRLPPSVVSSPWMLALIAHEAGHSVLPLVATDGSFGTTLTSLVATVATARGSDSVAQWSSPAWVTELFADWYAVTLLGPWAVWALASVELSETGHMQARRTSYPSALARVAFLARLCEKLGVTQVWTVLGELGLTAAGLHAETGIVARDIDVAEALADRLIRYALPNGRTLAATLSFRPGDFVDRPALPAPVTEWARALGGAELKADAPSPRASRLVVAGAASARWGAAAYPEAEARARIARIRDRTFARVAANADTAKRSASPVQPRPGRIPLATRLLDAPEHLLFSR